MKHANWRHATIAVVAVASACIALLWSWNSLAELFAGPTAEFRHIIALLGLAFVARALLSPGHGRPCRLRDHDQGMVVVSDR